MNARLVPILLSVVVILLGYCNKANNPTQIFEDDKIKIISMEHTHLNHMYNQKNGQTEYRLLLL
jgi:hypothetical protein